MYVCRDICDTSKYDDYSSTASDDTGTLPYPTVVPVFLNILPDFLCVLAVPALLNNSP